MLRQTKQPKILLLFVKRFYASVIAGELGLRNNSSTDTYTKIKSLFANYRSSHPEVFLGDGVLKKMQQIYRRIPMSKCDFNKIVG